MHIDPAQALFIGGQFNGAGYASNRRRSANHSDAVEVQALLDFVDGLGLQAIVELGIEGYYERANQQVFEKESM